MSSPFAIGSLLRPVTLGAAGLGLALAWVYWPTLVDLAGRWQTDARYSHGYVVPLFAVYLLYARRQLMGSSRGQLFGLVVLLAGLAARFAGTYLFIDWLSAISLLPCLAGAALLLGGWQALRWSWPAIAFLFFMVPLPFRLEIALSGPLQQIGTIASTYVLQTLGFVAFSEGNTIRLDDIHIGVVEACSGLSMLLIFFALSVAIVLVTQRTWQENVIIILSAIPIALVANITRITVTGILHQVAGHELAELVFHDLAGWLMMVLALVLLWLELRVLSWVLLKVPHSRGRRRREADGEPASIWTGLRNYLRALVRPLRRRRRRRYRMPVPRPIQPPVKTP
jgi:exosortase